MMILMQIYVDGILHKLHYLFLLVIYPIGCQTIKYQYCEESNDEYYL